mmetsp:Transcript_49117/g.154190  ORF Transcript_49117/g.154190 Transcript_49117/m.154190 type:complete len:359 (+) Transcript_49117:1068-2144(+)
MVMYLWKKNLLADVMVGKLFIAQALEVVPKLRQVVTLPSKVDLTLKHRMKLVLLERNCQVAGNFSQSIYKRKDQVNVDEGLVNDIRMSNLDSHIHRLPALGHLRPEARPVDLRDCPARHRPGVEELEHVIDGLAKRLLNDGLVVSHVVLWNILPELAECLYHVRREHVRPHRHPLPKLLKAAASSLEGRNQRVQPPLTRLFALIHEVLKRDEGEGGEGHDQEQQALGNDPHAEPDWSFLERVLEVFRADFLERMQATCFNVRLLVQSFMDQVRSCPSSYRQRQNVSPRRRTPCGLRSVPSSKHSDLSQILSLRPPRKTLDSDHGRDSCPLFPRPPCHVETTTHALLFLAETADPPQGH